MYGGGDPKVVYKVRNCDEFSDILYEKQLNDALRLLLIVNNNETTIYSLVIICGKAFLVERKKIGSIKHYSFYHPSLEYNEIEYCDHIVTDNNFLNSKLIKNHYFKFQPFNLSHGLFDKYFEQLCINLKQPIVHITVERSEIKHNEYVLYVLSTIPNLEHLGFPSIVSAEQMYQTVADFVANKLTFSNPMVEVTNDDKIKKHGFDKKSFRKEKIKKR
jgi:hypothetical protein